MQPSRDSSHLLVGEVVESPVSLVNSNSERALVFLPVRCDAVLSSVLPFLDFLLETSVSSELDLLFSVALLVTRLGISSLRNVAGGEVGDGVLSAVLPFLDFLDLLETSVSSDLDFLFFVSLWAHVDLLRDSREKIWVTLLACWKSSAPYFVARFPADLGDLFGCWKSSAPYFVAVRQARLDLNRRHHQPGQYSCPSSSVKLWARQGRLLAGGKSGGGRCCPLYDLGLLPHLRCLERKRAQNWYPLRGLGLPRPLLRSISSLWNLTGERVQIRCPFRGLGLPRLFWFTGDLRVFDFFSVMVLGCDSLGSC